MSCWYNKNNDKLSVASILTAVSIVVVVFVAVVILIIVSCYNTGAKYENQIVRLQQSSQSSLSNLTMKIAEMTQVPDLATDQLKQIVSTEMSGRYGSGGSKAMIQFFKEQNVNIDQKMYLNIQSVISGGRQEFEISQNRLVTQCVDYKNRLDYFLSGTILKSFGYPKIDLNKICKVVTDNKTDNAFDTGKQTIIKLH